MPDIAEVGFAVDTTDLARANRELDSLARKEQPVQRSATGIVRAADRMNSGFNRAFRTIASVQSALVGLGAGFALQRVVREFAQFERQLTEVGKTAGLQGRELDRLGRRIQEVGERVALPTERLLSLAAAAGQIGVKGVEDISRFAETMGQLELATDVAGEQGARSLGRLLNITGRSASEIDRLGSAITALGNNMAATEQEIVRASTFLASATTEFGLTTEEVVGLSGALVALGQRAETSGSAIGAAFTSIKTAITEGGEELRTLQTLTDQTASELRQQFGQDAVGVLLDFTEALGGLANQGNRFNEVLEQFSLSGRETRRVIGALASDTDSARDAVARANNEWEVNQALTREAARQAETFSGQMQLVSNSFNRAAVIAGRELAPVLLDISTGFREFLQDAADSGQIEAFFDRAARAAEGFLDRLTEIFRGIAAITLALKGASLGARIGGVPGAIGGGAAGGALGFFSPELLESLASELARVENQASATGQAIQTAMFRANGSTRNVIERFGDLNTQLEELEGKIGETLEAGADPTPTFDHINQVLRNFADAEGVVGNAVQTAMAQIDGQVDSVQELTTVKRSLAAQAELLADAQREAAAAANDNTAATDANAEAKQTLAQQIDDLIPALREELELTAERTHAGREAIERLQDQIDAEGDLARQKFIEEEIIRAQNEAMREGNLLREETVADVERLAGRLFDLRNETDNAADDARDLGLEFDSMADIIKGAMEEVGRSIQSGIRDALLGVSRDVGDIARRIAADIAAAFLTQRIVLPIVVQPVASALGLVGGSSSSGTAGGVGSLSNIGSGASLATKISSGLTTPLVSANQLANFAPSIFGGGTAASGGQAFANALAGTAAPNALAKGVAAAATPLGIGGGIVGSLLGNLAFPDAGIGGSIGAGVGGIGGGVAGGAIAAGTALGGPAGAAIGALLGSFGGTGIGGLFGGESVPSRAIQATFGERNQTGVRQLARRMDEASDEQKQAFDQIAQTLTQQEAQLSQALGRVTRVPNVTIGTTRRDGPFVTGQGIQRRSFDSLEDAVRFASRQQALRANLPDIDQRAQREFRKVLRGGGSVQAATQTAQQAVQIIQTIETLSDRQNLTETEIRIEQVRERFRGLIGTARDLGLETDVLKQARRNEIQAIREQAAANDNAAQSARQATVAINESAAAQDARTLFSNLIDPLRQFREELRFGQRSALSPGEQLANARGRFAQTVQAAEAGNIRAIGQLPEIGGRVIDLARTNFATGPQAANIEQQVISQVSNILANVEQRRDSLFSEFGLRLENSIDTQTNTLAGEIRELRTKLEDVEDAIRKRAA